MALKETFKQMRDLLVNITQDLEKAEGGNKAASQRVRTGTVKLEKIAKLYRKESIKSEKQTKGTKKPAKKAAAPAKAPAAKKTTAATAASTTPAKPQVSKIKAKTTTKAKAIAKPRALSFKRPTAKLPLKKTSIRA